MFERKNFVLKVKNPLADREVYWYFCGLSKSGRYLFTEDSGSRSILRFSSFDKDARCLLDILSKDFPNYFVTFSNHYMYKRDGVIRHILKRLMGSGAYLKSGSFGVLTDGK